uniref:(northern house mosquito) hypothetical protein n=1 Tax=Culex pipiens TaxID=7175 RepID=A0A8D8B4P5_CULPI
MRQHQQRRTTTATTETKKLVLPLLPSSVEDSSSSKSSNTWPHHQQDTPGHENISSGRRNRKIQFKFTGIDPHDGRSETSAGNMSTEQLSCVKRQKQKGQ